MGRSGQRWPVLPMVACFFALLLLFSIWRLPAATPEQRTPQPLMQDIPITVWNHTTQTLETMDLETYVLGVLAGEMPASYELEALKAQAVAARTYAYGKMSVPTAGIARRIAMRRRGRRSGAIRPRRMSRS